ncbi:MAG: hypothetical protein IJ365_08000, partial [Clostridia bacterium]|nr:hypothetical protein [Clostridia bacterium]
YGGYSLNERFLTSGISGCPDTWSVSGSAQLAENDGANAPDVYSLSVDGTEGTSVASTDFSPVNSADAIYRNGFLITTSEKTTFSWGAATGEVFSVVADNGNLYVGNDSIGTYKNNIWYDIQLNVNKATKAATVMINGGDTGAAFVLDSSEICSFSAVAQGGEVLIDDILAYEKNVYDVPEITKADSTDADVGMLRCDIWREGSHMGWDAVLPFANEREPYMGYYDDGNTLVSDWETKWLLEHGIDWQLNCWFIPKPYDGGAIKTPNNAYAIEEGYMRSEYSNMLDFAIMWENSTCNNVDEDIFRNNIVPYWTEHYIKDSRYKKVDGKPFVSIYNPSVFLENIGGGDAAKAKENIDYLRAEIKKLGFEDAVIMCADTGLSDVSRIKEMGFDGIHAYNWRDSTDNPATQQGYFDRAFANCTTAGIAFVPTVSGGIEETPWGRPAGKRASPDTVKSVLQYAKDNDYYNNSQYIGGDNLVILDSWNEIAEGHYLQPTAQDGFGYLDAIRQVACGSGEHTDDVPDEASKDIMGTLYPKNRKPNPAGPVSVPVGSIVEKQWSGRDLLDFMAYNHISNYWMSDGILNGISYDIDPTIVNFDIDIPVSGINYLKIKIKRSCADSLIKVYYVTDSMSSAAFSETNSVYAYADKSGQWETVYVGFSGAKDFSGNLKKLRIDPINSLGSFEIEEITLLKNTASELPTLCVNGESVDSLMDIPLQIVDGNVYMDYFSVRDVFDIKTSYIAAESKIAMVDDYY